MAKSGSSHRVRKASETTCKSRVLILIDLFLSEEETLEALLSMDNCVHESASKASVDIHTRIVR